MDSIWLRRCDGDSGVASHQSQAPLPRLERGHALLSFDGMLGHDPRLLPQVKSISPRNVATAARRHTHRDPVVGSCRAIDYRYLRGHSARGSGTFLGAQLTGMIAASGVAQALASVR